jgi:hypothetical protein
MRTLPFNRIASVAAIAVAALLPLAAQAQPAGVDPEARRIFKASTDFLAAQKRLSVDTTSTIEVVLDTGQKLQFDNAASLRLQRPDRLRADRRGDLVNQVFQYDGKTLTLLDRDAKVYATLAAPPTVDGMLDFAAQRLDIVAPAGDLIYSNAYDVMMADVQSGFVVGKAVIDGVRCDHLAFRKPDVDFQVWVQEGPQPLPRRLVITSRDVAGAPQFAVDLRGWKLAPVFAPGTFTFTAPKGARQIEFLAPAPRAQSAR